MTYRRTMVDPAAWSTELESLEPAAWPGYLGQHSGLPGPRANLPLAAAAAIAADESVIDELLRDGGEYQTMCAAAALGRRSSEPAVEARARALATDERWRVREGVAIGLQLLGDVNPAVVPPIVLRWADDPDPLVQRAAAAAICEPRLLRTPEAAAVAIEVCRRATDHLIAFETQRRKQDDARTLRQALAYCWSVAIAADPGSGLSIFTGLADRAPSDADLAWIVRTNRGKSRLAKLLV